MNHGVIAAASLQQPFSGVGVAPGRVLGLVRTMPKAMTEPRAGEPVPAGFSAESEAQRIKGAIKLLSDATPAGARTAERAVWEAGDAVAQKLTALGGYMADRATDVLDVRARTVAQFRGLPAPGIPVSDAPFILAAEDLAPTDTATLDPAKVMALVTSSGSPQSHTAIY